VSNFIGSTETRSKEFYLYSEDDLSVIEELLTTYAYLNFIEVRDIFWLTLDIRLFRKTKEVQ
jgi:hypothetical protein